MTRNELIIAVEALEPIEQGWYVNSDEGEPDCGANYCRDHAEIVARWSGRSTGVETWADSAGGPSDSAPRCDFKYSAMGRTFHCYKALEFGGLTNYGVDNALGLTETDPRTCHVHPAELVLSAQSMADDDARWEMWEHHARRLLAERSAS